MRFVMKKDEKLRADPASSVQGRGRISFTRGMQCCIRRELCCTRASALSRREVGKEPALRILRRIR